MPTVSAPVERPRILAAVAEQPGLTAYELAGRLGFSKPASNRVAQLVAQMHRAGLLVAGKEFRPLIGRPARVYFLAPPGTPRLPRVETPERREERRRRNRVNQQQRRARLAGKPIAPAPVDRPRAYPPPPPPTWQLPGDPACAGADPGLFFSDEDERPRERADRVAKAQAYCHQCPVRTTCLDAARERGERWGIWGGLDLETERKNRSPKRPGRVQQHPAGPDPSLSMHRKDQP